MNDELRTSMNPPMIELGIIRISTARLGADGVGEERREERPAGGADEEDVERSEGGPHAPQAVGHDRLQDRTDHRERGELQDRHDHADDGEARAFGMEYWIGTTNGDGDDQQADQTQRLRRVLAEPGVVAPGGERQDAEGQEPAERAEQAPLERIEVELLLDVEAARMGPVNRPKPSAAKASMA